MRALTRRNGLRNTLLLAGGILIASCSSNTATGPGNGPTISIHDFTFSPATLSVKVGTVVTWQNTGPSAHTTTADAGDADQWNSPTLNPPSGGGGTYGGGGSGDTYSHTFNTPGTFGYHCSIHPPTIPAYQNFVGSVVVTP